MPEFHYISTNLSVFEEAILFISPFLVSFITLKKVFFEVQIDYAPHYARPGLLQEIFGPGFAPGGFSWTRARAARS